MESIHNITYQESCVSLLAHFSTYKNLIETFPYFIIPSGHTLTATSFIELLIFSPFVIFLCDEIVVFPDEKVSLYPLLEHKQVYEKCFVTFYIL